LYEEDIFIGFYDGFIASEGFEESKEKVQNENLERLIENFKDLKPSNNQILLILCFLIILMVVIVKYPKTALTMMVIGIAMLPTILMNTNHNKANNYYAKLAFGEASIHIPGESKD
jgi:Flp pilus assembly protein TadB